MNKFLLFSCFCFGACSSAVNNSKPLTADSSVVSVMQHDTSTPNPEVTKKQADITEAISCDEALNRMFQTSNYHPLEHTKLSDYRIHINEPAEADDPSLGIQIFNVQNGDSALMGLLNFDMQTGKLMDLSPSLDKPVDLKYDTAWLKILRKQCGQVPVASH